jgi:hypothetical protein
MGESFEIIGLLCAIFFALAVQAQDVTSIESLLNEMTDRDSVARFPTTDFRLKQECSYNRASQTPDEPVGWFANKDYRNVIRTEDNNGRKAVRGK